MARQRLDLPAARDHLGRDVLALRHRLHGGAQQSGEPGRGCLAAHARRPLGPALGRARDAGPDRGQDGAAVPVDRARGEAADVSQLLHGLHGAGRERGENDVVGDEVGADVGPLGGPLAPGGELAQDRQLAPAEPLPSLDPLVALLGRHRGVALGVLERPHLLLRPLDAAARLELGAQPIMQREEVEDVLRRVGELLAPQRPAVPVGVGLVLLDVDLEHPLEERREPHLEPVAEERALDLRVDDAPRRLAHERGEDLEVLRATVQHHGNARVAEDGEERREVAQLDGIDHGGARLGGDLHDAELRPVRPLPHELGVEREAPGRTDLGGERVERVRCRDHPGRLHRRRSQVPRPLPARKLVPRRRPGVPAIGAPWQISRRSAPS